MNPATVNIVLQLLSGLLSAGPQIYAQVEALKAKLQQFQAEGRDPTDQEWADLFASIDADSARIDAADDRLNPAT